NVEESPEFLSDGQSTRLAERSQLFAAIDKNAVLPINVFGCETCCIGLGGTSLVKQFIVCAAFRIFFGSDDCPMFFGSDRSFASASDFGPCAFCQNGPREPTEIDR